MDYNRFRAPLFLINFAIAFYVTGFLESFKETTTEFDGWGSLALILIGIFWIIIRIKKW